jgi:tetratricopeptide (TPR) repeat protein
VRRPVVTSILVCAAASLFCAAACVREKPNDYEMEQAQFHRDIDALQDGASAPAIMIEKTMQLVPLLYGRASLTGSFADFKLAEAAIDDAVRQIGPSPDLYLLRAHVDFAFHRLADARDDLRIASATARSPRIEALRADLDLQDGKYQEAGREYENVIGKNRFWDILARIAYLRSITGDAAGAEALYAEAENEITAKEMRSYAWIKVQRGLLQFRRGRFDEALTHYLRADSAYTGFWFVEEHIAELLGAQRRFDEAVALYEKVIARAPKPELYQALGDLYAFMGKPDRAKPWHEKALGAYLESARRGEVHYFHHLAGFYADVREDGAEAVKWARKDLDLRRGSAAHDALAWALYRDGRFAEARAEIDEALAPGVQDAHFFFHAAMIHAASGRMEEGGRFLKQAAATNPRFDAFHVHR